MRTSNRFGPPLGPKLKLRQVARAVGVELEVDLGPDDLDLLDVEDPAAQIARSTSWSARQRRAQHRRIGRPRTGDHDVAQLRSRAGRRCSRSSPIWTWRPQEARDRRDQPRPAPARAASWLWRKKQGRRRGRPAAGAPRRRGAPPSAAPGPAAGAARRAGSAGAGSRRLGSGARSRRARSAVAVRIAPDRPPQRSLPRRLS